MKPWFKLSLTLAYTLFMSGYVLAATQKNEQSIDHIVAIVNKSVITQSELDNTIDRMKKQLSASHTPIPPANLLRKQVLDQLINRKLQLDMAEQAGIHVTEADVTQAMTVVAKKNRISLDKLYAAVAEQGLSKTEYRKEIHDEITINRIGQQMVGEKIFVSPQEVDDFMRSAAWSSYNSKEYHLQDILIALPEKPSAGDLANAKDRVRTVFTKLHRGANFLEVAASEQGGDLGWRKLPEVPSAFANRVVAMKENETAGPIQTANGFHFIRLAGIRSTGMQGSKAEQHQQVQELLYQRKYEEALQTWITKLRSESFVNTHPEN